MGNSTNQMELLLRGRATFHDGHYEDAAEVFRETIRDYPCKEAHYWLGLCLLRLDRPGQALSHLQAAADGSSVYWFYRALGEVEYKLRLLEPAKEHLEKALTLTIGNTETTRALLAKVQMYLEPEKARETLQSVIADNPRNGSVVEELARLLLDEGRADDAIDVCTLQLQQHSRSFGVYVVRARALLLRRRDGDRDRAILDLEMARSGNPRDVFIYLTFSHDCVVRALTRTGDERAGILEDAVRWLDDGLTSVGPGSIPALHAELSHVYNALGDFNKAEKSANRAAEIAPNYIANHLALCVVQIGKQDWSALRSVAHQARHCMGSRGRAIATLYEVLGALLAGSRLTDPDVLHVAGVLIRSAGRGGISSWAPEEWPFVRPTDVEAVLPEPEKTVVYNIVRLLDGALDSPDFAAALESAVDAGTE